MRWRRNARTTAWVRSVAPSLAMSVWTPFFTVSSASTIARAISEHGADHLGRPLDAEGDDRKRARDLADPRDRLRTTRIGKTEIQQDDIRLVLGDEVDGFRAGRRDSGDHETLALEERPYAE